MYIDYIMHLIVSSIKYRRTDCICIFYFALYLSVVMIKICDLCNGVLKSENENIIGVCVC